MRSVPVSFFFFNDTATTEIYTLSLHDALPIYYAHMFQTYFSLRSSKSWNQFLLMLQIQIDSKTCRSEEHTSELQSLTNLVCRLLLEKKKITSLGRISLIMLMSRICHYPTASTV